VTHETAAEMVDLHRGLEEEPKAEAEPKKEDDLDFGDKLDEEWDDDDDDFVYECPECNAEVGEDDLICPTCGAEFEE
jgi:rubrerythrin